MMRFASPRGLLGMHDGTIALKENQSSFYASSFGGTASVTAAVSTSPVSCNSLKAYVPESTTYLPLIARLNGRQLSTVAALCPNVSFVSELCHVALSCLERRVYALLDQKLPFRTRQLFGRLYGLEHLIKAAIRSVSDWGRKRTVPFWSRSA